jgi:hypothetical protein
VGKFALSGCSNIFVSVEARYHHASRKSRNVVKVGRKRSGSIGSGRPIVFFQQHSPSHYRFDPIDTEQGC